MLFRTSGGNELKNKILIFAAHPDDEILGCGGTAARLAAERNEISVAILGEGVTSRARERDGDVRAGDLARLKEQAEQANRIIGVNNVFFFDLPDNRFDTLPLLEVVKTVEGVKNKIQPDIVFTHFSQDLNVDHRITFQAVLTAVRPVPGETVKEIYSFEVLSSTEWNAPSCFQPDLFVDIRDTIGLKLEALKEYKNELKSFPHPRSLEGVEENARCWGMKAGLEFAEAFKVIRIIK
jgi:LmbE family N-acetylglucosaminyl deacetylase